MRLRPLALLLAAAILLSGCWDRRETNELSIVQALAFDWQGGEYAATAEVINTRTAPTPGSGGGNTTAPGEPETVVLTGHGTTPGLAMSDLTNVSSRYVFWPSTEVLLFGQSLAQRGIRPVVDLVIHFAQFPYTPRIFVVRGSARALLSARRAGVEISVAHALRLTAATNHQTLSSMYAPRLYDLMRWQTQKDRALMVTAVEAVTPRQPTGPAYLYNEEAVIEGGRLLAWLPRENVRQALWLTGRFVRGYFRLPCPPGPATAGTFRINDVQQRVRPAVEKGRLVAMDVRLSGAGDIVQSCPGATQAQMSGAAMAEVRHDTERAIAWAQGRRLDIFGWGEALYRLDPGLWRRLAPDWPAAFARLPVRLQVRVRFHSTGEGQP